MANTDALPVGSDYEAVAKAAIQTTFYQKLALERGGESVGGSPGHGIVMTAAQFADASALAFRNGAVRLGGSPEFTFSCRRIVESDGTVHDVVRARDQIGSGVDIDVAPDFRVRISAYQGTSEHGTVQLQTSGQELRLNPDRSGGIPYVEYRSTAVRDQRFAPMVPGGSDSAGEQRFTLSKGAMDSTAPSSSNGSMSQPERTMPATMTLLTSADRVSSKLYCVQNGLPKPLTNGYQQSGHITYNGLSMVELSSGRVTVLYDKAQLVAHAGDPANLERELESGAAPNGSAHLRVSGGQVIDGISRAQALDRAHPGNQSASHER
jgi:hypothetical protein